MTIVIEIGPVLLECLSTAGIIFTCWFAIFLFAYIIKK